MVQDLIAALAAHALPPDLFAAVTSALVLGDQALRRVEKTREMAAERQRRKRSADAKACHVTSRDASFAERYSPNPLKDKTKTKKKGEVAHPLPIDWQAEGDDLAYAESAGLDVEATAAAFRDYWHGKGRVRADWSEAWRYHCDGYGRRPRLVTMHPERASGAAQRPVEPRRTPPVNHRSRQAIEALRALRGEFRMGLAA